MCLGGGGWGQRVHAFGVSGWGRRGGWMTSPQGWGAGRMLGSHASGAPPPPTHPYTHHHRTCPADGQRKHAGAVRQVVAAVGQAALILPHTPAAAAQHTRARSAQLTAKAGSGGLCCPPHLTTPSSTGRHNDPKLHHRHTERHKHTHRLPNLISVAISVKEGPRLWYAPRRRAMM